MVKSADQIVEELREEVKRLQGIRSQPSYDQLLKRSKELKQLKEAVHQFLYYDHQKHFLAHLNSPETCGVAQLKKLVPEADDA